ncbi:unnamed protein product, partial [Closterium sp. NIES-54]
GTVGPAPSHAPLPLHRLASRLRPRRPPPPLRCFCRCAPSLLHLLSCCTSSHAAPPLMLHLLSCCTSSHAASPLMLHLLSCCIFSHAAPPLMLHLLSCCISSHAAPPLMLHLLSCCTSSHAAPPSSSQAVKLIVSPLVSHSLAAPLAAHDTRVCNLSFHALTTHTVSPALSLLHAPRITSTPPGLPMALHLTLSPSVSPALFLLAGYEDGRVALWDVRRPDRPLTAVRLHSQPVQSMAVWSSAEHGMSGGADRDTVIFRLSLSQGSMEAVQRVRSQQPGTAAIALHPAGGVAATGGWDGSVRVYDCALHHTPRPAAQLTHHSAACTHASMQPFIHACMQVTAVVFTPEGQLCSASRDTTIALCRSR